MEKVRPLQNRFLKFHLEEQLGVQKQSRYAEIIDCAERTISLWFNRSDPEDLTLLRIAKAIRRELKLSSEGDEDAGNDLVEAFDFIREVQNRSASVDDVIPALSVSFLRKQRLVDAHGEPTDKLIKWLNSTPPPLAAPRYISREQAFTESETTSAIWLNPHNHYSLPLVGRDAELALLDQFMNSKERFKIAALVAPSGAGKTRLVSQWAKPYIVCDKSDEWHAGFVESPNASLWNEENWQPSRNTLIIIDYTYNYADVIGAIMKRFESDAQHDIRLLVLDHVLPEKLHQDTAFRKGVPSLGFREANSELFFETWPISLDPISNTQGFLCEIIAAAADPFTEESEAKRFKPDSPEVVSAADALMEIGAVDETSATRDQIKRRDAVRHPLFAALLGQMLRRDPKSDFSGMTRRDLVGHYFENERRLPWSDEAQDPTLGYWVGFYVSAATLLRGVAFNDVLEFQDDPPKTAQPVLGGSDFKTLRDICGRFVSSEVRQVIMPFEPDILGETFVLNFLAEKQTGTDYRALASLLSHCCQSGRFEDPVGSFLETIQRLVRNLINDDQELDEVQMSWSSLERFLDPKWFPGGSQVRQAVSIALGETIKQRREATKRYPVLTHAMRIDFLDLAKASETPRRFAAVRAAINGLDCLIDSGQATDQDIEQVFGLVRDLKSSPRLRVSAALMAVEENCLLLAKRFRDEFEENLNAIYPNGWSSIIFAAFLGRVDSINFLVDEGVNPDLVHLRGDMTAFLVACAESKLEAAKALGKRGADVHARAITGMNAVHYACLAGDLDTVIWLANQNIDIFSAVGPGWTPFLCACQSGNLELMKFLYRQGADIHVAAEGGYNAVLYACRAGYLEIAQWLFDHGVDINAVDKYRHSALMMACEFGHLEVVEWLCSHGCDIHARNEFGDGPLSLAKRSSNHDIVRFLLQFTNNAEPRS